MVRTEFSFNKFIDSIIIRRVNSKREVENLKCIEYKKHCVLDVLQIVCYYTNWSQYRVKIGKFTPEDIQPDLCTHVIFAFGWLKKNKLTSFESNDETKDGKIGLYERIVGLKKANPSLKVLLAIGKCYRSILIKSMRG